VVTKIKAIGDRDDPGSSFLGAPGRDRADPSPRPDKSRDGSARDEPSRGQRRDRQPPAASLPTSAPPIVGELAPSATGNSGHDTEPSDVIAIPQQNPPHQPKPQSDVDPKPPEPLRLPTPDTPPNPHGPDLPSPEKPGTEPATDPPPPDTPS
jgi:hypothetical protein